LTIFRAWSASYDQAGLMKVSLRQPDSNLVWGNRYGMGVVLRTLGAEWARVLLQILVTSS